MPDKAAIAGTYSDFKIIRSRKVAQLIIEVPIEQAQALITALGLPNPAEETWVAVARLKPQTPAKEETPSTASVRAHRPFPELPYPQQAALRCNDLSFRDFLRHRQFGEVRDADAAARIVRSYCEVDSRADIKPGTKAEKLWLRLNTEYTFWESARAA
jgi:hypothetical protein